MIFLKKKHLILFFNFLTYFIAYGQGIESSLYKANIKSKKIDSILNHLILYESHCGQFDKTLIWHVKIINNNIEGNAIKITQSSSLTNILKKGDESNYSYFYKMGFLFIVEGVKTDIYNQLFKNANTRNNFTYKTISTSHFEDHDTCIYLVKGKEIILKKEYLFDCD